MGAVYRFGAAMCRGTGARSRMAGRARRIRRGDQLRPGVRRRGLRARLSADPADTWVMFESAEIGPIRGIRLK